MSCDLAARHHARSANRDVIVTAKGAGPADRTSGNRMEPTT